MAFVDVIDVAQADIDYGALIGGHIDRPHPGVRFDGSDVEIAGWVIGRHSPVVAVELVASNGVRQQSKLNARRPDLAEGFTTIPDAELGGFLLNFRMPRGATVDVELHGVTQDGSRPSLGRMSLRRRWRESKDPEFGRLVSVVIPCYQQAHFLTEAIESVLAQTHRNIEVCVVDDGSTDNTSAVVARYPTVRYIRQVNEGVASARNRGLRETNGDYLVFLDADDLLLPNALADGLEAFHAHPEAAFVFGDAMFVMEQGDDPPPQSAQRLEGDLYTHLLGGCPITHGGAVMYRRAVFERIHPFDTGLRRLEDYDLYYRVAREFPIWHYGTVVAKYRRHGANVTSTNARGALPDAMRVLHRQRAVARREPEHWHAYRVGINYWSYHLGLALTRQVQLSIGEHRWRDALGGLATLARWWPRGVATVARSPRRIVAPSEWKPTP